MQANPKNKHLVLVDTVEAEKKPAKKTKIYFIILAIFLYWFYSLKDPVFKEDSIVLIEPKDSTFMITAKMEQAGLEKTFSFFLISYLFKFYKNLKAGEYKLSKSFTIIDVLIHIARGKVVVHRLPIPEGLTVYQIIKTIKMNPFLKGRVYKKYPEGSLMPATYNYVFGENRQKILDSMKEEMDRFLNGINSNFLKNNQEILTLASIVEKETAMEKERSIIAGVFLNRLKINMPLQSDPTVIYAITDGKGKLNRPITRRDLKYDSPYNTYVYKGLPPAPIACPGKEAIIAVLNPSNTSSIYFVANGKGGHSFSDTLEEHNKNVQKWRQIKRALDE